MRGKKRSGEMRQRTVTLNGEGSPIGEWWYQDLGEQLSPLRDRGGSSCSICEEALGEGNTESGGRRGFKVGPWEEQGQGKELGLAAGARRSP